MSLRQDVVDIYTKSSVYYLRLQYLIICYLIVLAGAFFVLPMQREMGIDGAARLMIGGFLYIGFAVLMISAPKLLYSTFIGKWFYGDDFEEDEDGNSRDYLKVENWFSSLLKSGLIHEDKQITVTGYSLGGHLATAFHILHQDERIIKNTFTFNGAGVGYIGGDKLTTAGKLYSYC